MSLQHLRYVELPVNRRPGGFDHAAIHGGDGRLYVAHTANDAVDIVDCAADRYLESISGLPGVAGVLVAEEIRVVFTSNRSEDTVGIFGMRGGQKVTRVKVGHRPNGLAYDALRNTLLVANVGNPTVAGSATASIVDVAAESLIGSVPMPGRTRWAVFDGREDRFFVNIADPPTIVVIDANHPTRIAKLFDIPAAGPHGLDLDPIGQRLFCACDGQRLVCLEAGSGRILEQVELSGTPDVIFFNSQLAHLYVAIGDPGLIDVVDTHKLKVIWTVRTEPGAHTLGFDAERNKLYAFLPGTQRAAVYHDPG